MVAVVKTEKLTKEYINIFKKKKLIAVTELDIECYRGEIFTLLGPNGAGKTTTIKMCCGLLTPTQGNIWIEGYNILTKEKKQALKVMGVLLEGSRNIYGQLTVYENLIYFGRLKFMPSKLLRKQIDFLLEFFELIDKKDILAKTLSRGFQQKLAIAIALINDPQILFLDEPTVGLDVHTTMAIKHKIKELAKLQKTIILTTHQMDIAEQLSDRVGIINHGKLVAFDNVKNLKRLFSHQFYEFKIEGELSIKQLNFLKKMDNFKIEVEDKKTLFSLTLKEPAYLYQVIDILKEENSKILSVNKKDANLEEIFLKITSGG